MNTDNAYIAFNKDGDELLLYKTNKGYINLLKDDNRILSNDEIDLSSIEKAKVSLKLRKHMMKFLLKKQYIKDRNKMVFTKDYLVGTICKIDNVEINVPKNAKDFLEEMLLSNWRSEAEKIDCSLFLKDELKDKWSEDYFWKDIISGNKYLDEKGLTFPKKGLEYVYFGNCLDYKTLYSILKVKENYIQKKKVYEVANELKKIYK